MGDLVSELERGALGRFARWDKALWRTLVEGPGAKLAASLKAAGTPGPQADKLLEAYLRLACEGIGLGYLFPRRVGESVFTLAWFELIPRALSTLPSDRRLPTLAAAWNLGENLEREPAWLRRIFLRVLARNGGLADLPGLVARIEREASETPARALGETPRIVFVDLGAEDRLFLPGTLHFVAPTVLCVHDRLRAGGAGEPPVSLGVWLADEILVLGPMGCAEAPGPGSDRLDLVEGLARREPRASDALNSAANAWRAGVSLETSQSLVAALPA